MWTSTLDLEPARVIPVQLLGRFWRGAYFSSFAPFQVQNLARQPLPAGDWVRVRNRLAGICGSDLHLVYTDGDFRIAPAALPNSGRSYPGHEVVGEVIEVGDEVHELNVGDTVVLEYAPNCLTAKLQPLCRSCASGNYSLCESGYLPGPAQYGGGWSEEMLVHEQQLFRIPNAFNKPGEPQLSDEQAVMLEPTSVALHAVLRNPPAAGDQILIVGAGTIGLLILQVVRALSPQAEISVLARHPFQVEQATRMGAKHIIYPHESYKEVQRVTGAELYEGFLGNKMLLGGFDVIYDTIGSQNTLHNALRWIRARGGIVVVGVNLHLMHIDLSPIWHQEVSLIGTLGHGMELWPPGTQSWHSTFEVAADLIEQGLFTPEQLITHRFALNDYRHALLTAADKKRSRAIKVIFDYALQPPSVVPNVRAAARPRRPIATTSRQPGSPLPIEFSAVPITPEYQPPFVDDADAPPALTIAPETSADEPSLPDEETATGLPAMAQSQAFASAETEKQKAFVDNVDPQQPSTFSETTNGHSTVTNPPSHALHSLEDQGN